MTKQLTPLEAFDKALDIICKQKADNNLQSYIDIIEAALEELDEYKKCIDLEQATYISTHNMSVMDTETYNLLHKRSQILELFKDKLDFYFDEPHQCVKVRLNHRLVAGKELIIQCNKEEFNSLKEF